MVRLFIGLLLLLGLGGIPGRASEPRHVLLLNSYDQRMSWVQEITRAVEETLKPEENDLILHVFNMDSKRYPSEVYIESLRGLFRVKYASTRFSLILASDNNAFDFLRAHRDELFPGAPVAFCGLNDFRDEDLKGLQGYTGVAEVLSPRETVELILNQHPDTREIFIINDYLESGRKSAHDIEGELEPFRNRVHLTPSENLPIDGLKARIAGLGKGTVVLLGVYYADRDGRYLTFERIGALLAEASRVPVYCLVQFNIGQGVIGGKVISGYYQGQSMALLGKRILAGEAPSSLPVVRQEANRFIFDHAQLRRFKLGDASLPPGSLVLNRPVSIFETHKKEIWATIGFICALLATVLGLASNLALRRRTERELRRSEERFRQLAEASWEGILVHDRGLALRTNGVFLEMFGFRDEAEIAGQDVVPLITAPSSVSQVRQRIAESSQEPYELTGRRQDGTEFPMEVRVRCIEFTGREVRVAAFRDLTEQKRLEERLAQSQKMEAIGTLSGGIAHDFNNILAAIFGYTDLLMLDAPEGSRQRADLENIQKAANRAKGLVQQILAFSRQSKRADKPLHVGSIVKETMKMLRASLPATIEIQCHAASQARIMADPTQIHQVVMNLCTNAALAMRPDGGRLEVSLDDLELKEGETAAFPGLRPGPCLCLAVSDTGCGMSLDIQRRIFEPFFTTRPQGEGTGLGLSVVHGVVRSLGGAIAVESEPGRGSTFKVILPALEPEGDAEEPPQASLPKGGERILFVDDEPFLVDLATRILGRLGYRVTAHTRSEEALALFAADPSAFDLVITDMTMPKLTGDVLVARIRAIRPGMPAILCTGYSERLTEARLQALGPVGFAMKPVKLEEIARTIRTVLDTAQD